VCTNNGTRGESIARLELHVDIAKTQASFNNLFYITNILKIIILVLNIAEKLLDAKHQSINQSNYNNYFNTSSK
jgi:hypothetical protein